MNQDLTHIEFQTFSEHAIAMRIVDQSTIPIQVCSGHIYFYQEDSKLWNKCGSPDMLLERMYANSVTNTLNKITVKQGEYENEQDMIRKLRSLSKLKKHYGKNSTVKAIKERMICIIREKFKVEHIHDKENPYHIPIKGGKLIDIRTKEIRDRTKQDFFMNEMNASYSGSIHKDVVHYFGSMMKHRKELVDTLQKVLGFSLSGLHEKYLFLFFGPHGDNGKSLLMKTLETIMGEFCGTMPNHILVDSKFKTSSGPDPALIKLVGKRLATASELKENQHIDEDMFKKVTGNDRISVRDLYKSPIEFTPRWKSVFLMNKPLYIDVTDDASRNRIFVIPFDASFKQCPKKGEYKRDDALVNRIQTTLLDDVFTWLVDGAHRYYKEGLQMTGPMLKHRNDYLGRIDTVHGFIKDRVRKTDDNVFTSKKAIATEYYNYCQEMGEIKQCNSKMKNTLISELSKIFGPTKSLNGYPGFRNLMLLDDDEVDETTNPLDVKIPNEVDRPSLFSMTTTIEVLEKVIQDKDAYIKQLEKLLLDQSTKHKPTTQSNQQPNKPTIKQTTSLSDDRQEDESDDESDDDSVSISLSF